MIFLLVKFQNNNNNNDKYKCNNIKKQIYLATQKRSCMSFYKKKITLCYLHLIQIKCTPKTNQEEEQKSTNFQKYYSCSEQSEKYQVFELLDNFN